VVVVQGEVLEVGDARHQLVDVSHDVEDGMVTYRGLPAPVICDYLSREASRELYAEGTEFQIGKLEMVANTGTYVDAPFHRYAGGKDLSDLPLTSLADLDAVVVRHEAGREVGADAFEPLGDLRDKAVLVNTGWDRHWRTEAYFEGHPFLVGEAADYLVDSGVALVGIDSYNIDDTEDGRRPVHTALLGEDIPIVEHMRGLDGLPDRGARFFAVPVKVKGFGTFPVRAFGVLQR
jgi:arylformamidase